jgi:hypothetical protein
MSAYDPKPWDQRIVARAAFQVVLKMPPWFLPTPSGFDLLSLDPAVIARCSVAAPLWKPAKTLPPRSGKVEAISVHHLGPRRHEVFHELLLRVRARIDFG